MARGVMAFIILVKNTKDHPASWVKNRLLVRIFFHQKNADSQNLKQGAAREESKTFYLNLFFKKDETSSVSLAIFFLLMIFIL